MHIKTAESAHHAYDSQAGRLKGSLQQLAANLMYAAETEFWELALITEEPKTWKMLKDS